MSKAKVLFHDNNGHLDSLGKQVQRSSFTFKILQVCGMHDLVLYTMVRKISYKTMYIAIISLQGESNHIK